MDKYIIAYIDTNGNIVDYVSANNSDDLVMGVADELSRQRGEKIKPYHAKIVVDAPYRED